VHGEEQPQADQTDSIYQCGSWEVGSRAKGLCPFAPIRAKKLQRDPKGRSLLALLPISVAITEARRQKPNTRSPAHQ
jgi:hypothetical protein